MLRIRIRTVEIGAAMLLIAFGLALIPQSLRLGAGWSYSGPQAGFFPLSVTLLAIAGSVGALYSAIVQPNSKPFFEVSQEIVDLVKVGVPILVFVYALRWLGLFVAAGLYIGFSMWLYGKFRWWYALVGAVALPAILWMTLREAFNISMPMSAFYRSGALPF